jgi:hypothetical protein
LGGGVNIYIMFLIFFQIYFIIPILFCIIFFIFNRFYIPFFNLKKIFIFNLEILNAYYFLIINFLMFSYILKNNTCENTPLKDPLPIILKKTINSIQHNHHSFGYISCFKSFLNKCNNISIVIRIVL